MRFEISSACLVVTLVGSTSARPQDEAPPKQHAVYEKKDDQGRLLSRVVFNVDGTLRHTAFIYGQRAAKVAIDVEFDRVRDPQKEKRETFDEDGRIVERKETVVQDGQRVKTTTTYEYDAAGRQTIRTKVE
jgi:hypothetical protein